MTYILIIMLLGGSKAVTTQEFRSQSTCEAARAIVVSSLSGNWSNGTVTCVRK